MIQLKDVTKFYLMKGNKRHYVVRNVSLDIPTHKSVAILGPNGAGKSTLLRLIGGAESPNSGKIVTDASISWPLGVGVGFQGSLTGRQNVLFICEINGLSRAETRSIVEEVIQFAEIGHFFDMPVKTYSSGMRARLGFGLSISFDFDYYLIDELTSVGDTIFRVKAKKEFQKIRERASLIFVSHNLQVVRESCESALVLIDGDLKYFEDLEDGVIEYKKYIDKHSKKKNNKLAQQKSVTTKAVAKKAVAKKAVAKKAVAKKIDSESKKSN